MLPREAERPREHGPLSSRTAGFCCYRYYVFTFSPEAIPPPPPASKTKDEPAASFPSLRIFSQLCERRRGRGGGQRASLSPPNPTRPLLSSLLYLPPDASVPSLRRWPRGGGNPWDVLTVDTLVKRVPDGARHDGLQRAWHSGAFFFLHRQGHPLHHVGQDFRHQLVITLLMTAKEVKGSMSDRAGCSGGPLQGTPPGGTSRGHLCEDEHSVTARTVKPWPGDPWRLRGTTRFASFSGRGNCSVHLGRLQGNWSL